VSEDGAVENLAGPLDRNVMPGGPAYPGGLPQLTEDGRTVVFCVRDRGCTHVYSAPVDGGAPEPVLAGAGRVASGLSVAGGAAAVTLATPTSLGEIVVVDLASGEEHVRTAHGASDVDLYLREERTFSISDGSEVHGWLMRDASRTGPQPLLLDVHGGPHNAWNGAADELHLYHQELVDRGWTILIVNPRGSDGYGEDFYDGVRGAWGVSDAKDFLEPIDELVAEGTADPKRLAVTGYSYGGYMTCYLTSRDGRFAAGVAGGVVADLTTQAGTADMGHFMNEYELGGRPWSDRERFDTMSPYAAIDHVDTPTLILHGAADLRCPVGQAQQWFTALRERGVPTRLVLYPEAGHLFILEGRPSHRIDYNQRVIDWVEEYAVENAVKTRPSIDQNHWQQRLAELAERHKVPGATLGILRMNPDGEDELVDAAYGLLNRETGVETTTDSVFQIGSITKVWTATVVMQLVDEGLLDLDAPVADVLPELRLADENVAKQVTMRQLLTHTSGIDGDIFTDTGRGDDAIEKYVAELADAAQNHPIGATWSYCNSGFTIAGRVIEKVTGGTWDAAMRERLFTPLALERTGTLPEEALLYRAAVGHVGDDNDRAPAWVLPRSAAPAGLINSSAKDVLAFARMHLAGGVTADGTRLLSEESAAAMTEHQADVPDKHTLGDSWGIGWIRFDWNGTRLIGHDGNTLGQAAFLRLLPEEGVAVTLLTNGGHALDLYEDLYRELFKEIADVEIPNRLGPPDEPVEVDVDSHVGTYERASVKIEVLNDGDGPLLRTTVTGPIAALMPKTTEEYALVGVEDNLFVVRPSQSETWIPVKFYELPSGEKYMHFGARATPKTG
jgi:CubicO group peptidase (beta-lactamase class C family)/poly(3-hydroxybutyrate) depolymerase